MDTLTNIQTVYYSIKLWNCITPYNFISLLKMPFHPNVNRSATMTLVVYFSYPFLSFHFSYQLGLYPQQWLPNSFSLLLLFRCFLLSFVYIFPFISCLLNKPFYHISDAFPALQWKLSVSPYEKQIYFFLYWINLGFFTSLRCISVKSNFRYLIFISLSINIIVLVKLIRSTVVCICLALYV